MTGEPSGLTKTLPLVRLRYGGSATRWGFAIYLASRDGYQDSILPTGDFADAPKTPSTGFVPHVSCSRNLVRQGEGLSLAEAMRARCARVDAG